MNLKIKRKNQFADLFRHHTVYINDLERGIVNANDSLTITNLKGNLRIIAKIDWCTSNEIIINADNYSNDIQLTLKNNGAWINAIIVSAILCILAIEAFKTDFQFLNYFRNGLFFLGFIITTYRLTIGRKNYLNLKME